MLDDAYAADSLNRIGAIDLDDEQAVEVQNIVSAHQHALSKDTPAKTWWHADYAHPAIARALHVDPGQLGARYALAPFRLWKDGERHLILAAYPAPRCLGPVDWDWLGIQSVIAWEPRTDAAFVLGDPVAQLVGTFANQPALYASPRDFFTDWMRARAEFFVRWLNSRRGEWAHGATERDDLPGMLAIGPLDQIRWNPSSMPENIECVGLDPAVLNRALLRAARVPRAHQAGVRAVA